jgi:hypothetical protein
MEMREAEPIRDIPVLVLTPGKSTPLSEEYLSRIGDNVQQVIAPASEHWIHLDEPDLVIRSIRAMVAAAASESIAATCDCAICNCNETLTPHGEYPLLGLPARE